MQNGSKAMPDDPMTHLILEGIKEIKTILGKSNHTPVWLSLKDAVKYSGLSASTLKRYINKELLKCSNSTGKLMLKTEWIDRFMMR